MADKDWRSGKDQKHKADTRRTKRPTQGEQELKTWPKPRTQGGHEADTWGTPGGQVADKDWRRGRRTQGGQAADEDWRRGQNQQHKADTRRISGGQVLEARPKPTMQGRQLADKRRICGGQAADKVWRRGQSQQHKANKWRTRGGQAPETRPQHIAASLFS